MQRLNRLISEIIESDIGIPLNLRRDGVIALKKIFATIASSKPFKPNIEKLATLSGLSRPTVYEYLYFLHLAGLTKNLHQNIHKAQQITSKPEKICIANPNLLLSYRDPRMSREAIGACRESFFVSQFAEKDLVCHPTADFAYQDWVFEIGGPTKTTKQIKDVQKDAYLVVDGEPQCFEPHKVPLYLFGFQY